MTYQINFTDGTKEFVHNVVFIKIEKSDYNNKGYQFLSFISCDEFESCSYNLYEVLNFTAIPE